ncbi:DUF4901 domain-containing protein [Metasolibacillus meyeri]|uniref:DUF4901 domain-containing protein n=1 Tax=Metasolibacillus meyeri TaxID=1071052 RepID=A0AAW9NF81_9BACL|nr:YcdB/YcdC domain-containing protein [Metasolibacillus meyeri]MEC1177034.1 DUF4901 domain-containing protein [Metasolibacillus meyeri]
MLKEKALQFVTIPNHFKLIIEDYREDEAAFVWTADEHFNNGIAITLNHDGQLLNLSIDDEEKSDIQLSTIERRHIAETFLLKVYPEALQYFTLTTADEREKSTIFRYHQFVANVPLNKPYCFIEVSAAGKVIEFRFNPYTKVVPNVPKQLFNKNKLLAQCVQQAKWQLQLRFLSQDVYAIEQSGLFLVYESEQLYELFDAVTGTARFPHEEEDVSKETYLPFPSVQPQIKRCTLEEIIGIPDSMQRIREEEIENLIVIVWRDQSWQSPHDLTFEGFIRERSEHTVKVRIDQQTKKIKDFLWFKQRTGDLQLNEEQCQEIACSFMATYFEEFLPFLRIKDKEEAIVNEKSQRFSFQFYLYDGESQMIEGETFRLTISATTGLVDSLMGPSITVDQIKAYIKKPVIGDEQFQQALRNIDAQLIWHGDEEQLMYQLCDKNSNKNISYLDATTGELICSKF